MNKLHMVVIIVLMFNSIANWLLPSVSADITPTSAFGYSFVKEANASNWIELEGDSAASIIISDGWDDYLSSPIGLLFNFPFFEFHVSSIKVSTNGFISFDSSLNNPFWSNMQIPMDAAPNNIIAALWDDLKLSDQASHIGKVLSKTDTSSGKKFIVEWVNVTLLGSAALLKFEIILYESGNIELIYKEINGDVTQNTIGIEDSDGVDGIEAFYNGAGFAGSVTSNMTLRFIYPPASYRVKAFPAFQSDFTKMREVLFQVNVRNTSALMSPSSDSYKFDYTKLEGDAGWTVKFLDAQTQLEISNTGSVARGATKLFLVRLIPPAAAQAGAYIKVQVKIESIADSSKRFFVTLQASVAASFMQLFSDYVYRINLNTITPKEQLVHRVSDSYDYGSSLAIAQIYPQDYWYFTAWQEINNEISNIQYIRSHAIWGKSSQIFLLTNNLGQPFSPKDKEPAVDVISSENIAGFAFLRELTKPTNEKNYNIFFHRVASNGDKLGSIENLTKYTDFGYGNTRLLPILRSPKIAAVSNQFTIVWEKSFIDNLDISYSDIFFSSYSSNGNQLKPPTQLTNSTQDISYKDPSIINFGSNKTFITYFSRNSNASVPANERDELWLKILDINGDPIGSPIRIGYYYGQSVDMVQLGDRMVIAWINNTTNRINYAILNESGALQGTVKEFVSPDKRNMANFSITKDPSGTKAIFTWENSQADRLYYAMINTSGVVTPPMIFRQGEGTNPVIRTGAAGGSVAPLKDFSLSKTFLPLMRK